MPIPGKAQSAELRLLGGLLAAPGAESLGVLRGLAQDKAWLQPALEELADLPLEEWQAEHARLFICGHPRTVCPPFESARLNGMMPGPATAQLAEFYRRAGLEPDGVPADYLGTMLECAAFLAEQDCGRSAKLAAELWQEHFSRWLPDYGAQLAEESRFLLYRQLGTRLTELANHG